MRGNLTVEAALIVPFSLIAIGVVCWLGIYQYNLAVLHLTGYESVIHMTEFENLEKKDFEEELLRYFKRKAEERTLAVVNLRVFVKMTERKIKVDFEGTQQVILSGFLKTGVSYTRMHPEKIVRITDRIWENDK